MITGIISFSYHLYDDSWIIVIDIYQIIEHVLHTSNVYFSRIIQCRAEKFEISFTLVGYHYAITF